MQESSVDSSEMKTIMMIPMMIPPSFVNIQHILLNRYFILLQFGGSYSGYQIIYLNWSPGKINSIAAIIVHLSDGFL